MLGVLLVHNSKCIFRTAYLGILFNKYMADFNTYIYNDTSKLELLNIPLTIFINVMLCISDTPFVVVYLTLCHTNTTFLKEFSERT